MKIIIECSCGHSFVSVWDDREGMIGLTLYTHYRRETLWGRFKSAIKYLWTGRIEADELILYRDEGIKLRDFLNEVYANTE